MRKIFLSILILAAVFAVTANAQSSSRVRNLADQLQRNTDDLADRAYGDFTNRYSNSRSDLENLLTANQLKATADVFRRLVNDNRSNSELRDVAQSLNELSRRTTYSSSLSSQLRDVQRNIDDLNRELGGGGGRGDGDRDREKEVIGRVRWRGTVDDEVNLVIRRGAVEAKTISGRSYSDAIFTFTSPLPDRKVEVGVDKKKGRGQVKVLQMPSRENDFTAVIQIRDKDGGAKEYDLDIFWTR